MTQPPNRLSLAKQGNPKALAAMLNQSLQPKGITAKVGRKDDCLQILLESAQTPDQEAMVAFTRNGLIKLEVESIKTVKVYGRQTGEESLAWSQEFELVSQQETFSDIAPTKIEDLSSYQTVYQAPRAIPPKVETPLSTGETDFQNPSRPSATKNSSQRISPISIGDVVSAAVRLYRDHFNLYFGLAFTAYLWILVPVYGWAKFSAISGLLSRLAFKELIERPETVTEARRHVMPRMWSFLGAGFLVGLLFLGVLFGATMVFSILVGIVVFIQQTSITIAIFSWLLMVIAVIAFFIGYVRLISRLLIVEVPLAVEENVTATSAISRSIKLTDKFARRLQWIIFVAFLVTLPISIVVQIALSICETILRVVFPPDSPLFGVFYFLVLIVISFASGSLLIPFWQALKAVIYCDLRSRREGLGLEIRNSL